MEKQLIVDLRGMDIAQYRIDAYSHVLLSYKNIGDIAGADVHRYVCVETKDEVDSLVTADFADIVICSDDIDVLRYASNQDLATAAIVKVDSEDDLKASCTLQWCDYVFVDFNFSTNIPLELLLATYSSTSTLVYKFIRSYKEAQTVFGVMERGSDGVIMRPGQEAEIVLRIIKDFGVAKDAVLEHGKIIRIEHIGMGVRACIDTTSVLEQNSGMIIGSTSNGGILVSSETHYLPYMKTRPFRVNAGAVHSYVFSDKATQYISELSAGDTVMVVNTDGKCREVSVGRIKLERRPLLLIEAQTASGQRVNAIVQDDWHIRIFGKEGKVLNVTDLNIGDEILVYTCNPGRHVGLKIDEFIEEK